MKAKKHGATVSAPDESAFVDSESPKPGPVAAKNGRGSRRARGESDAPPDEGAGFFRTTWSLLKLALGVALVVAASGAVAWGAHRYALSSPRFAVRSIEVKGSKRKSEDQIAEAAGVKRGDNVFAIDTNKVEQRLLTDPWIKEVKVARALPSTLSIELEEREVGALASIGEQLYLVTRTGEPFKQLEEGDPSDQPVLTGVTAEDLARDRPRAIERLALGLEIVRHWERIPMSKVQQVQEVHLAPGGDVSLTLGKSGITVHIGRGPWRKKLLMAERVIGQMEKKGRVPGIVFADNVAHPERVVVRMR
ncbi:MAG: FtsQ-type POTRA domain-containing protein [Myxococcales bacterium]|nr:FtsQ-type POTRA domain-containing protein [Myxococcales bacterium]